MHGLPGPLRMRTACGVALAAFVALLAVPAATGVIVAGPFWEVQAHNDGTFTARTGASMGTADENLKSIIRSWTLPAAAATFVTLRTESNCALCTPPTTGPSDYWIPGSGPLALNSYPHPVVPDPTGISWTYTINNGPDQLTLFQRVSQGGTQADRSWVSYQVQVCNQSNLPTRVGIRLLADLQAGVSGGPWQEAQKAWISPPPGPYTYSVTGGPVWTFDRVREDRVNPTELGYVYERPDASPNFRFVGLLNDDPAMTWLPGPVVPPDRFAYWSPSPSYGAWDITGATGVPAGDEVVAYWWGATDLIQLAGASAASGNPCFAARVYWVPFDAVFPPPPTPPEANFSVELGERSCLGQLVTFTDTSTPAGAFAAWSWDFGDDTDPASGATVTHAFFAPGTYIVTLTAIADGVPYTKQGTLVLEEGALACPPLLEPFEPRALFGGESLLVCAVAAPRMGGILALQAGPMPPDSSFDPDAGCFRWNPSDGHSGLYCVWIRATEDRSGLSTDRCLVVRVRSLGDEVADDDGDGRADDADNCPDVPNPDQADRDGDGIGDACKVPPPVFPRATFTPRRIATPPDADADGVPDASDNCRRVANLAQRDLDGDGAGDLCDLDLDGDNVPNPMDTCPLVANRLQGDADLDGKGDACDIEPGMAGGTSGEEGAGLAGPAAGRDFLSAARMSSMGWGALAFAAILAIALLLAAGRRRRGGPRATLSATQ